MKVFTLINQIDNAVLPIRVFGPNGYDIWKGVLAQVPYHIAKCEIGKYWFHSAKTKGLSITLKEE